MEPAFLGAPSLPQEPLLTEGPGLQPPFGGRAPAAASRLSSASDASTPRLLTQAATRNKRLRLQFWGAMSCSSRWLIQEPEGRRRDQGGGNCEATAAWTRESTAGSEIGPAVEGSAERSSPSTGGGVCGTPRVKGDSECLGLSGWKVTTH